MAQEVPGSWNPPQPGARRRLKIAVDLDLTLAAHDGSKYDPMVIGPPLPGAVEVMRKLSAAGHRLIIFTCRGKINLDNPSAFEECGMVLPREVKDWQDRLTVMGGWLRKHGIPFDEIYVGQGKPVYDLLLDDRALRLVDWQSAEAELVRMGVIE